METTLRSTQLLRADHQDVLSKLDTLQRAVDGHDRLEAVTPVMKELGTFFRTGFWALVWKEEDALFPAIRPFVSLEADSIAQMRLEHAELRGVNERFQGAVDAYLADPDDGEALAALRENTARIVTHLRHHIPAEDQALLAVADAQLDEVQDQQILDAFKAIDADLEWAFENLEKFYP